jgi:hypothetical protein
VDGGPTGAQPTGDSVVDAELGGVVDSEQSAVVVGMARHDMVGHRALAVAAGDELHAPVVGVDFIERHPELDRQERHAEAGTGDRLVQVCRVLVPRRVVGMLRRLVDEHVVDAVCVGAPEQIAHHLATGLECRVLVEQRVHHRRHQHLTGDAPEPAVGRRLDSEADDVVVCGTQLVDDRVVDETFDR